MRTLELDLYRKYRKKDYTIGILSINGRRICDTLEDPDRGLDHSGESECSDNKIKGRTCIPYGRYQITLKVRSPKFGNRSAYDWCDGYLPRLIDVPHFDGILIHAGNSSIDTEGCILVGENTQVGKVLNSMNNLKNLYNNYLAYYKYGEIFINIHK